MKPATKMPVPQVDLQAQYATLREEIREALERVCASQRFILGPEVAHFERELAAYCGVPHAVGCASGSDALLLSLMALGVKAGAEVITVPFTFFATVGVVARIGARARFVDIEPGTFNLDAAALARYLQTLPSERRGRTQAVIPVHLYGQPAEMKTITALAEEHKLAVIEDAAQALGADYAGQRVGGLGLTGCFSFFPSKNLGGYGDGGLMTTRDAALAAKLRSLRTHGIAERKFYHALVGMNSRLDELQAAVLRVKLRYLERWTQARQVCAAGYDRLLAEAGLAPKVRGGKTYPEKQYPVVVPQRAAGRTHVFNQYVIRVRDRERLRAFLAEEGVGTEVYYPQALHLQECFAEWGGRAGEFPESERAAREVLALPMYPELSEEQQRYVVNA
ncbi:MAG: DegT/DnrJ/EryC1/StrS family aminotransferase, partial [Terriglobia bacterium]